MVVLPGNETVRKAQRDRAGITQEIRGLHFRLFLRFPLFQALACRILLQRSLNPPLSLLSTFPPFGSLYEYRLCDSLFPCGHFLRTNLLSLFVAFSQCGHR